MTRDSPPPTPAIGFTGLLALLFIGLKLTGFISWPWLWVLCPLWIPVLIAMTLLAVAGTIVLYQSVVGRHRFRQRARRREQGLPSENEHGPAHRWGRNGR